jgi:hypothetical protein
MSVNLAGELSQKTGKICLSTWQMGYLSHFKQIFYGQSQIKRIRIERKIYNRSGNYTLLKVEG